MNFKSLSNTARHMYRTSSCDWAKFLRVAAIVLLIISFAYPVSASDSALTTILKAIQRRKIINNSPYKRYALVYAQMYRSGEISKSEFVDKIMQLEMLEQNRRTQAMSSFERVDFYNRMQDSVVRNMPMANTQSDQNFMVGQKRYQVKDQYGNDLGYIQEQ